jgi:hypothetical protein
VKIRSITCFIEPGWPVEAAAFRQAGSFIRAARPAFEAAGYEVQTVRLATPPFARLVSPLQAGPALRFAAEVSAAARQEGFSYTALGPALPGYPQSYALIPEILAAAPDVFLSAVIASPQEGVSLAAVQASAAIIRQAAGLQPNGFGNLYFAALANVPPGAPFFPAAYHAGGPPAFALACEAADLAVQAFRRAGCLAEARQNLIREVEAHARRLEAAAASLSQGPGAAFSGLDFTPAPFPETERSLGAALELLGLPALGLHGSLAAAAFLADALDRAVYRRAGFNGLMLPVLEDAALAARVAEGQLTVNDLLLYASVCGTGLDTIPLPGDTPAEALSALLLDLAALSLRLNKPLTARLMPIPGKQAGDLTGFDFPFFANSRVMGLRAAPLHGLLGGREAFELAPRQAGGGSTRQ